MFLGALDQTNIEVGFYVLMNAIDIANPGLSSDGRNDIAEPMVSAVVQRGVPYKVTLTRAQMVCQPIQGQALCAFGVPKG